MPLHIRLIAYAAIPVLFSSGSFLVMRSLIQSVAETPLVLGIVFSISLLLGLLPALLFRLFVHSQLQQGFAHMDDGSVRLPGELGIAELAGNRIRHWQAFEQRLSTTVRLHGRGADLLVSIHLNMTLIPDEHGRELAKHIDEALPLLEQTIQECLYSASRMDDGLAKALDGSALLNEEDERVLKSKFLCALETLTIDGIFFPHEAAGIQIERSVTRDRHLTESAEPPDEFKDEDLLLDETLLKGAGIA
jgi:hypothetical protein